MTDSVWRALGMAFAMGWEILWPLILGFALSAVVQAVVSHREMARLLPDDRPRSIATALALGAGSSSCSYAAVALARSMAAILFITFYAAMAAAALIVELIFGALGLVPSQRNARVVEASITWDYTTWLNIAFLILAGLLVWRFFKTGGLAMLRMMNKPVAMGHAR
jgi:uncharacterized membrane protein YraQ (UPF0718 family)